MVDLEKQYLITSNRESGFGRYDVLLETRNRKDKAIVMEFKVQDPDSEKSLNDTVEEALCQIKEKGYIITLVERGIPEKNIFKYGFAFCGKTILIGGGP